MQAQSSASLALQAAAVEIVLEEDLVEEVILTEQLVRVADNAIFMLDTSTSMDEEFRDTGKSKLQLVNDEFIKRAAYFPEIGHQFGIYSYTRWKEIYPMQTFTRASAGEALKTLPSKGDGPTPIKDGLQEVEKILPTLSGKTAIFVFSDGEYTGANPVKLARKIATENNVCFYVISTAEASQNNAMAETVASLNACSRVIPFEYFLYRPEYTSGALFDVLATETIVTTMETRVAGVETQSINFAFGKTELSDSDKAELDEIGEYMTANPDSYGVIAGYTDSTGPEEFNIALSRDRAQMVADYMYDTHDVGPDRLVLQWYGPNNPMASNDTAAGRAVNRRVEIAVGTP